MLSEQADRRPAHEPPGHAHQRLAVPPLPRGPPPRGPRTAGARGRPDDGRCIRAVLTEAGMRWCRRRPPVTWTPSGSCSSMPSNPDQLAALREANEQILTRIDPEQTTRPPWRGTGDPLPATGRSDDPPDQAPPRRQQRTVTMATAVTDRPGAQALRDHRGRRTGRVRHLPARRRTPSTSSTPRSIPTTVDGGWPGNWFGRCSTTPGPGAWPWCRLSLRGEVHRRPCRRVPRPGARGPPGASSAWPVDPAPGPGGHGPLAWGHGDRTLRRPA